MFATPTVVGASVYIGSCAGRFYALDKATGSVRWTYDIRADGKQSSFHSDPLVLDEQLILGTDYGCGADGIGHVYAFDLATGRVRWKYRSTGVPTPILRLGDRLFFGTFRDEWSALDLSDGQPLWTFSTGAPNPGCMAPQSPAAGDDRLFLAGLDGTVYALDARTGRVSWKRSLPAQPTTSLAFHEGLVYLGTGDARLSRLDPRTGNTVDELTLPDPPTGRLSFAGGRLYVFVEAPEVRKGYLVAVKDDLTRIAWSTAPGRPWTSERPHLWKDLVVSGNCRGELAAVSAADGTPRWSTSLTGCVRSIGDSGDMLFVGAQEGTVYALEAK